MLFVSVWFTLHQAYIPNIHHNDMMLFLLEFHWSFFPGVPQLAEPALVRIKIWPRKGIIWPNVDRGVWRHRASMEETELNNVRNRHGCQQPNHFLSSPPSHNDNIGSRSTMTCLQDIQGTRVWLIYDFLEIGHHVTLELSIVLAIIW